MARRPLNPWVADFVKDEIEAVLAWSNRKKSGGFVKLEDDGRFSDDGSNFRNAIASLESGKDQLQLIKVLTTGNTVNTVLSDGQTCIKARLSDNAVDIFESALDEGEQLDLDVTGDVIRLKSFTIVTTAFGSEEDYIQLTVEDIDYCHHLRKTVGDPVSIEKDPRVRPLIDRVIKSLVPADPIEEWDADQESAHSQVGSLEMTSQASIDVPRSSPPVELETQLRSVEAAVQSGRQNRGFAASSGSALRPQKRSAAEAGLEEDGFEMQAGVNLDRPVNPLRKPDPNLNTKLFGLLSNKRAEPETIAETPARAVPQSNQEQYRQLHEAAQQEYRIGESQEMATNTSQRIRQSAPDRTQQVSLPSSPPIHITPGVIGTDVSSMGHAQVGKPSTQGQPKRTRSAYGRRKIPANQKKLLDLASSWLPSLPGLTFPRPNIPIEILKKWNATPAAPRAASPIKTVATMSRSESATPTQETQPAASLSLEKDEHDDENEDDDEDDDIPASQWPSSAPEKPDAPPVSSLGDVIHDDRSVSPKRPDPPPDSSFGSLVVSPPKIVPTNKALPKSSAASRSPLPARPNVPPSLEEAALPSSGREDHIERPPASWSRNPIPTGPRNPAHYRGDFSSGGQPYYGPRRSESLHSQSSQPERTTPREAHAYRFTFGSSRPVSAAVSPAASFASVEASRMPLQQSVDNSPRSVPQSPSSARKIAPAAIGPHSQASPQAVRGSIQQSVDRSIQAAANVIRAPSAEAHSEADKRPPFERSLGPTVLAASSRSALQSSSTASRRINQPQNAPKPSRNVVATPPQARAPPRSNMRHPSERPTQPLSRSSSSAASLQPPTLLDAQSRHRHTPGGHPADLSNRLSAERASGVALDSGNQESLANSTDRRSSPGRASGLQHHSQSSDGPSQIPASCPTPQSKTSAKLAYSQTARDRQLTTQQALSRAEPRASPKDRRSSQANGHTPMRSQQVAYRPAQELGHSSPPASQEVTALRQARLETPSRPHQTQRSGSASRQQPTALAPTLPSTRPIEPKELNRRQRQLHREAHRLPARPPPPSANNRFKSTTPASRTLPAASASSSSAVSHPAADAPNRNPFAKPEAHRRTGLTGVSGSPANQQRLAKTTVGADGAEEAKRGISAAGSELGSGLAGGRSGFPSVLRVSESGRRDANVDADETRDRLKEFFECYRRLAPGGAFAVAGQANSAADDRRQYERRRGVDVLQWNV